MKQETEHLNIKNGKILGLLDFDAYSLNGIDLWDKIASAVETYAKIHPLEMEILVRENKAISESRKNDLAMSDKTGMRLRWGASIPPGLLFKLEQVEPMLFSNKKLFHKFLNKYKGFKICKRI